MGKYKIALYVGKMMTDLWEQLSSGCNFAELLNENEISAGNCLDGQIIIREFETEAEREAYIQGARDTDGWEHQAWCFNPNNEYSSVKMVKDLIVFGQQKHHDGEEGIDLCEMDGFGTGYLVGTRELRFPVIEDDIVWCESNNVHELDEDGNEIEGAFIRVKWEDMTPSEQEQLKDYLLEYARWDGD